MSEEDSRADSKSVFVAVEEWSVTLHSCTNTLNIINDSTAMNLDLLQLMHGRNDVPTCDMGDA